MLRPVKIALTMFVIDAIVKRIKKNEKVIILSNMEHNTIASIRVVARK
jgi:hypothetical protein|tara:strand:+ start:287 stop:430 length:144 start_codon:yes stop_codon:yes gene_type:complete